MLPIKTQHYELALKHLESADDSRLPYAALELRMCLEALVYEKLRTYARHIPDTIKKQWKPDQALRALVKLEPAADKSFRLLTGRREEPGVAANTMKHVRTHHTVSAKWVRKNYNKLGALVHETQPFTPAKYPWRIQLKKNREALEQIADEIRAAAHSDLGAAIRPRVRSFTCSNCGMPVVCNELALEEGGTVTCFGSECGTEYRVSRAEDDWAFTIPTAEFRCVACKACNLIQERLLRVGLVLECTGCGEELILKLAFVRNPAQEVSADDS